MSFETFKNISREILGKGVFHVNKYLPNLPDNCTSVSFSKDRSVQLMEHAILGKGEFLIT